MVVALTVTSMDQMDMWKNYLYSINLREKKIKSLKKQLHKKCKYEHTMNAIS